MDRFQRALRRGFVEEPLVKGRAAIRWYQWCQQNGIPFLSIRTNQNNTYFEFELDPPRSFVFTVPSGECKEVGSWVPAGAVLGQWKERMLKKYSADQKLSKRVARISFDGTPTRRIYGFGVPGFVLPELLKVLQEIVESCIEPDGNGVVERQEWKPSCPNGPIVEAFTVLNKGR